MPYQVRRSLHQAIIKLMLLSLLASTLAGLIPPPLVRSVLPPATAELAEAVLPTPLAAQAAPLTQAVNSSNVLTITKNVVGGGSGPYNITVTGPGGYSNNTTVSAGSPRVLTGLANGTYTVTESSPGPGWTTTYSLTNGTTTANSAIVNLANPSPILSVAPGLISGNVYRDFDSDGVDDGAGEVGVAGVTVTTYDRNGNAVGSTTTDSVGDYSLTPTANGPWRLEFSTLPADYEPTTHGSGNGTSTQFVNAPASNINLGINQPCDYCQNSPQLMLTEMTFGDPLLAPPSSQAALLRFNYDSPGTLTTDTTLNKLGAAWGLAYQRTNKLLFVSAFQRRFTGYGPLGTGGIYYFNRNTNTLVNWFNVNTIAGVNTGADPHTTLPAVGGGTAVRDPNSYDAVGKISLGDIDLSTDDQTLWAVNLNQSTLLEIPIVGGSTPATPTTLKAHDLSTVVTCTNGVFRPWGLKFYNNKIYVGGVCSAENGGAKTDLSAHVLVHDPAGPLSSFSEIFSMPLNYAKGCSLNYGGLLDCNGWNVWQTTWPTSFDPGGGGYQAKTQPILSDIEFDVDGSMILGFTDRWGYQTGSANYQPNAPDVALYYGTTGGDVLRICLVGGSYVAEGGAGCPKLNNDNIASTPQKQEFYQDAGGGGLHPEAALGALAFLPGRGEIVSTKLDPQSVFAVGVYWVNNTTGVIRQEFNTMGNPYNKASSIGDIELLCDPAPIEIGNRVWDDLDSNGVQDPGEPGLNGLTVSLQGPTGAPLTTNTSGDGNYYFGNLSSNTSYTLTLTPPSGYSLTQADVSALSGATVTSNHPISDTRDSDAVLVAGKATIYYTTGTAGQNNHGLDFGFTQPAKGKVDITNIAPGAIQVNKQIATTDGSSPNVVGNFTINVNCGNVTPSPGNSQTVTDGGTVTFNGIPVNSGCTISENTSNLPAAPNGYLWLAHQVTPNQVIIGAGQTTVVTVRNTLAPKPTASGVLTITKTLSGTGSGSFNLAVTGPNGYNNNTTITPGTPVILTGLTAGVYTVTEASPGAGWTTVYTATPGSTTGSGAVVNLFNPLTPAAVAPGALSGTIYRDFNSNGQMDTSASYVEIGAPGIIVTAYAYNGNACGSATSNNSGTYSFTPTCSGPWRLEFTNLPAGYEPTTHGTQNGTSTQFVTSAPTSNLNFGINHPADYSPSNPYLATAQFWNGTASGSTAMSRFRFDATGEQGVATDTQIGSVWGLAYAHTSKTLYAATFLKRHTGIGPGGLGAIYAIPNASGATVGTPTVFATVPNVGTVATNASRGVNVTGDTPNTDAGTFDQIAKVGLGDIDISDDESTLWTVNLNTRSLVKIPVYSPSSQTSYAIPLDTCGVTADAAGSAIRINVAGNAFTDSGSPARTWLADTAFTGGALWQTGNTITNINNPGNGTGTSSQSLYQGMRYGSTFSYSFHVPNGAYTVRLHFADVAGAFNRAFSVKANGTTMLTGINPYGLAGNQVNRAVVQSFTASVASGKLQLDFVDDPGGDGNAIVSGIEVISQAGNMPTGEFRPFATKTYRGQVYVGGVCNAEYSLDRDDLNATVYQFNPTTGAFTAVFTMPLTYTKGRPQWFCDDQTITEHWNPWITEYLDGFKVNCDESTRVHPSPILSDLEFDIDGSLILGFSDRFGHQTGWANRFPDGTMTEYGVTGGDVLRAGNVNGVYQLENNGQVNSTLLGTRTGTAGNNQGPGGGEFYNFDYARSFSDHQETSQGGLALLPGTQKLVMSAMDPDGVWVGGVTWGSNVNGTQLTWLVLQDNVAGGLRKGGSQGDVELLSDPAPIEIGNRVWNDINGNGVQDPGEPGLNGLTVSLQGPTGAPVATNTSGDGNYYFTVSPVTAYTITLTPPNGYNLTTPNSQALAGAAVNSNHPISDTRDSDAVLVASKATIFYTTGGGGQNNHGLDFGFTQPVKGKVDILNTPPTQYTVRKVLNTVDPVRVGDPISFTLYITNTGGTVLNNLPLVDSYPRYLEYVSASLAPVDNNDDGQINWNPACTNLAPNTGCSVVVTFIAFHDTTLLPGGATVNTARSGIYTSTASVRINAPTAVEISNKSVHVVDGAVVVQWAMVTENTLIGFHLWREDASSQVVQITNELIPAQKAGQSEGAAYTYTDSTAIPGGIYRYVLELIDNANQSSYSEVGRVGGLHKLYLPALRR